MYIASTYNKVVTGGLWFFVMAQCQITGSILIGHRSITSQYAYHANYSMSLYKIEGKKFQIKVHVSMAYIYNI